MARQNGQLTFQTPSPPTGLAGGVTGDDVSSAVTRRAFTASERVTVVEVGACATDSLHVPSAAFAFKVVKRTGGLIANDVVVDVFKSQFAAEGGVSGDPSIVNFDAANKIPNGIVTNTLGLLIAGKCLRALCEVTLDKGDQLVFFVTTGGGALSTVVFYAKAYCDGAGMIETNDVESN